MPGFTAIASLYQATGPYLTGMHDTILVTPAVLMSSLFGLCQKACGLRDDPKWGACGARYVTGASLPLFDQPTTLEGREVESRPGSTLGVGNSWLARPRAGTTDLTEKLFDRVVGTEEFHFPVSNSSP
jgi:hypothetical protein